MCILFSVLFRTDKFCDVLKIPVRGEKSLLHDPRRDVRAFSVEVSDARDYRKLVDGKGEVTEIQTESRLWLVAIFWCHLCGNTALSG